MVKPGAVPSVCEWACGGGAVAGMPGPDVSPSCSTTCPAPPPTLSAGLFLWGRSATCVLPAQVPAELRRLALVSRLTAQEPCVLQRIPCSVLAGSTLNGRGVEASTADLISAPPLPGALNTEVDCSAYDAGWLRSPRKALLRSGSTPNVFAGTGREGSPRKSPLDFFQRSLRAKVSRSNSGRPKSIDAGAPSSNSRPNSALLSLVETSDNDAAVVEGNSERSSAGRPALAVAASTTADKGGEKPVDKVRVVWSEATGDDKLRRQLMMDRVGALARSLGRPNHGMMQLKTNTNSEPEISDIGEIMNYALGPSDNPGTTQHRQRGWWTVAFEHMKVKTNGQPEATCSKIILSLATVIGLLGYDAYYVLSSGEHHDDKILTGILCVLTIFVIEFYCVCACTQGLCKFLETSPTTA